MARPDGTGAAPAAGAPTQPAPSASPRLGSALVQPVPFVRLAYVTPEGWWWLLTCGALWAVGLAKGINLITLLATLMGVAWLLNFWLAGRRLHRLRCGLRVGGPVFARTPFGVDGELTNLHYAAQVGLRLENRGPHHALAWFVTRLGGGESIRFHEAITVPRRGWHPWPVLQISSGYPFGLAERRARVPIHAVLAFPALGRLHRGRLRRFLTEAGAAPGHDRAGACRLPAAQTQFHALRAFRAGDSPRRIHWRTSARRGELMVREFEDPPTANLVLVLEPWRPAAAPTTGGGRPGAPEAATSPFLEEAVSLAATICWEWCRQKGDQLVLAVADLAPVVVHGVTGPELALLLLEALALVEGAAAPDGAQLAERLQATPLPAAAWLVISTRPSQLAEMLSGRFHRPVASLDVSARRGYDFFERATDHAS